MSRKIRIILILAAVITPAAFILGNHISNRIQRAHCAESLRNLTKTHVIYAGDYSDDYTLQAPSGCRPQNHLQVIPYDPNNSAAVGASLYLLKQEKGNEPNMY